MNARPMFDPRMLNRLRGFYPSTCNIIAETGTIDSMGSPENTDDVILSDIPCAVAPFNDVIPISGERRYEQYTQDISTIRISLKGYYPEITEKMLAVVSPAPFKTYNIRGVEHDSHQTTTRLIVDEVTT
jgi:hypothetical protein